MIRDLHLQGNILYAAAPNRIIAFNVTTKPEDTDSSLLIPNASGIWSDGTTMWVAHEDSQTVKAYTLSTKAEDTSKDIAVSFLKPSGIDGSLGRVYIASNSIVPSDRGKLFEYLYIGGKPIRVHGNPDDYQNDRVRGYGVYEYTRQVNNENQTIIYPLQDQRYDPNFTISPVEFTHTGLVEGQPEDATVVFAGVFPTAIAGDLGGRIYIAELRTHDKLLAFDVTHDREKFTPTAVPEDDLQFPDDVVTSIPFFSLSQSKHHEDATVDSLLETKSYVTLKEGLSIALCFSATVPAEDTFASALLRAMPYIEQYRDKYVGEKTFPTQALQWPRKDSFGGSTVLTTKNHESFLSTVVPYAIKEAQVYTAIRLLRNENPFRSSSLSSDTTAGSTTSTPTGTLLEQKVGSITLKYSAGGTTTTSRTTQLTKSEEASNPRQHELSLHDILRPFLRYGTGLRLSRV